MGMNDMSNSMKNLNKLRGIINQEKSINNSKYNEKVEENNLETNTYLKEFNVTENILKREFNKNDEVNYKNIYNVNENSMIDKIGKISISVALISITIGMIYMILLNTYFKEFKKALTSSRDLYTLINNNVIKDNDEQIETSSNDKNDLKNIMSTNDKNESIMYEGRSRSKDEQDAHTVSKNEKSVDYEIIVGVNTKFKYITKYKNDSKEKVEEKWPEHDEKNITVAKLKEKYSDWNIILANEQEIVFEKEVLENAPDYYVLKALEGKVAIYDVKEDHLLNLIEITDVSINSLTSEDILALEEGIYIYGEENLIRKLESMGS